MRLFIQPESKVETVALESPESLATWMTDPPFSKPSAGGTGAVHDASSPLKVISSAKAWEMNGFEGRGVIEQLVGGIAQRDQLLELQLDLAELRLAAGEGIGLVHPVGLHPAQRESIDAESSSIPLIFTPLELGRWGSVARARQFAPFRNAHDQFGREILLHEKPPSEGTPSLMPVPPLASADRKCGAGGSCITTP